MANKKSAHYVDDVRMYEVICEYKKKLAASIENGTPKPRIPEYCGECIMMIADKLSTKHNFARYIFKDEMVSDGIENCIKYFDNFNEEKYKKPFTYFTTIIYWAFVRRIEQEKTYLYTKYKLYENNLVNQVVQEVQGGDDQKTSTSENSMDTDKMTNFINNFESKQAKKKVPKVKKGVEKFVEEN